MSTHWHKQTNSLKSPMFGPESVRKLWHPVTLRSPELDAKQFGNIKRFTFLLLMKERHPRLVRQGWRFFVCASWLISASGPSTTAIAESFALWIVLACGEQGHFAWRIVCSFRNKYPATCCSAFRIRGGVLCNTKTQAMSFMVMRNSLVWTRQQVFMVLLLAGF